MSDLDQHLYITYSNQKARDLKRQGVLKPLDRVITLDNLILELFESKNFEMIIDETIASSIIYKIIQDNKIEYFSYLNDDAVSLNTIYNFIIKCKRNNVVFEALLSGEKLEAISQIDKAYQTYKQENNLVDIADVEDKVLTNLSARKNYELNDWELGVYINYLGRYRAKYVDEFTIENINYVKSYKQEMILKFLSLNPLRNSVQEYSSPMIMKPRNEVFDNIDEVKTAIRIARKLLEEGVRSDEILIVASDIQEYAPLYKLYLDEYGLKGYSSIGTPLSSFHDTKNHQVKVALNNYDLQIQSLEALYKKLNLSLSEATKEKVKSSITILDEKIGIEITEPNQLVGLHKSYEHILFIGTDINHFPPKSNDNFLYTYEDDVKYFYANNYFTSSQTQLEELKRLSDSLYIVTASYSGKRELSPSILLDDTFDDIIDISDVKSVNQLALESATVVPDAQTSAYYESIMSDTFTGFDGEGVEGLEATHLSASQINSYLSCPLKYLYSSKVKLQAPMQSDEGFDVMEQGSLMHLCYELFGKKIKENSVRSIEEEKLYDLMYQVSIEAYNHDETRKPRYKEELKENIHHQIFLKNLQAGLKDDRSLGLLAKFVDYYRENAGEFEYFKYTEFEKEFALDSELKPYKLKDKGDKDYFIKGFIDRFDNQKKYINIVDYKSKKVRGVDKAKQQEIDSQKDIQLALYILYASQQHPNKIYDSYFLSFKGNEKGVKFATLSNDDMYTQEYENDLKTLIHTTKDNIENGKFGFDNSDEKVCGWCDYKFICHESVLKKSYM